MTKSLVIVESPAKAKTINKYLGANFFVTSSIGHIRDLPTKSVPLKESLKEMDKNTQRLKKIYARMGIEPDNNWNAHWEILAGKEKLVKELKQHAKKADVVYLATDLDREGEAIAWHLAEILQDKKSSLQFKRIKFNEITKNSIHSAFKVENITEIDIDKVNAQQARRFLDRIVGFMLSPLLWEKVARNLSAGRVQSVAVKLIVEREQDILSFTPEEYWTIEANLHAQDNKLIAQVKKYQGKDFNPKNKQDADRAIQDLQKSTYKVLGLKESNKTLKPNAPFITSTLQRTASYVLGFSVKKTMLIAQKLYESGYITYMRTDSTNLSTESLNQVRGYIKNVFNEKYLPAKPRIYSNKDTAQEAHEAIRPSDVNILSGDLKAIDSDAVKLYELIWKRFVACQMSDSNRLIQTLEISASDYILTCSGSRVLFDGWQKVIPGTYAEQILPLLKVGDILNLESICDRQHFTKGPARYSEATLVKELEERGIGRPSTYASIISTIQERGYVVLKDKRLHPEKISNIVTKRLDVNFKELMNYNFTAKLENKLDEIAYGKIEWKKFLDDFYTEFKHDLDVASQIEGGMLPNVAIKTDIVCPVCNTRNMEIRTGATGRFLGCVGYRDKSCKGTINLNQDNVILDTTENNDNNIDIDNKIAKQLLTQRHCDLCNQVMDSYIIDSGRKLHICSNNPDCCGYFVEIGSFISVGNNEGLNIVCDKCNSTMFLQEGRFGKYFKCNNENCSNTRKLLKNGMPSPPKMEPIVMLNLKCSKVDDHYILRDGATGLFLAASKFPKTREIRAPLLIELQDIKTQIIDKYRFLFDKSAPLQDQEGNFSVIRYNKKTEQIYLRTEKNGKPTGWRADFHDNAWVVSVAKK